MVVAVESLRAQRERLGLTQAELARLSGIAQPNIAAYESGKRVLSAAMRERLGRAMIRPSQLLVSHRDDIVRAVNANRGTGARVFGSVARGTDLPGSDLDLLVDFDDEASLFDLARLHLRLEELLGIRVDVIDARALGPKHAGISADAVAL